MTKELELLQKKLEEIKKVYPEITGDNMKLEEMVKRAYTERAFAFKQLEECLSENKILRETKETEIAQLNAEIAQLKADIESKKAEIVSIEEPKEPILPEPSLEPSPEAPVELPAEEQSEEPRVIEPVEENIEKIKENEDAVRTFCARLRSNGTWLDNNRNEIAEKAENNPMIEELLGNLDISMTELIDIIDETDLDESANKTSKKDNDFKQLKESIKKFRENNSEISPDAEALISEVELAQSLADLNKEMLTKLMGIIAPETEVPAQEEPEALLPSETEEVILDPAPEVEESKVTIDNQEVEDATIEVKDENGKEEISVINKDGQELELEDKEVTIEIDEDFEEDDFGFNCEDYDDEKEMQKEINEDDQAKKIIEEMIEKYGEDKVVSFAALSQDVGAVKNIQDVIAQVGEDELAAFLTDEEEDLAFFTKI